MSDGHGRHRGREPWGPYDGVILAVVAARLFEPPLRVPSAGAAYLTPTVFAIILLTVVVNVFVIARLHRRKRRGYRPIYPDSWYWLQLVYGLALMLLLALVLPTGHLIGRRVAPFSWSTSLGDLLSGQLFFSCALVGLRLSFPAVPRMVPLVFAWISICMALNNRSMVDWTFAGAWAFWAFINTMAGALGGKVLTRMMEIGYTEEERVADRFRAHLLPSTFVATSGGVRRTLAMDSTALLQARLTQLQEAVQRASSAYPDVAEAWKQLMASGEEPSLSETLDGFVDWARREGINAHLVAFGLDMQPSLSVVEESYVQWFLHVVLANIEQPRANPDSLSLLIDVDRLWLRLRAIVHGDVSRQRPSDGFFHSVLMLQRLTALHHGKFLIVPMPGFGEVVESRIPRSSAA